MTGTTILPMNLISPPLWRKTMMLPLRTAPVKKRMWPSPPMIPPPWMIMILLVHQMKTHRKMTQLPILPMITKFRNKITTQPVPPQITTLPVPLRTMIPQLRVAVNKRILQRPRFPLPMTLQTPQQASMVDQRQDQIPTLLINIGAATAVIGTLLIVPITLAAGAVSSMAPTLVLVTLFEAAGA
jgi:hypothetical protein